MIHRYDDEMHIGFSVPISPFKVARWDPCADDLVRRRPRLSVTLKLTTLINTHHELRVRWGIT